MVDSIRTSASFSSDWGASPPTYKPPGTPSTGRVLRATDSSGSSSGSGSGWGCSIAVAPRAVKSTTPVPPSAPLTAVKIAAAPRASVKGVFQASPPGTATTAQSVRNTLKVTLWRECLRTHGSPSRGASAAALPLLQRPTPPPPAGPPKIDPRTDRSPRPMLHDLQLERQQRRPVTVYNQYS